MVNVLMGTVLGFLSGLGIGGGSLLLLWLTLGAGMDSFTARGINLLFFLPAAVVSCCFRWKQGSLELKRILPAVLGGCLGAGLGTWLSGHLHTEILKKGFGILLILTGIRELCYHQRMENK
jgi:uncharacterized membrane protein YfcA